MLVAGEGLGEDETNGAAARPVVAAREGRAREVRERESERTHVICVIVISRARASLTPQAGTSRAELDLSLEIFLTFFEIMVERLHSSSIDDR